jgi:hypothetical protein
VVLVAVGSPRPFSFRAPAALARAQLEQALQLLAGRQVDHTHPALSLFHLALRLDLHREAVTLAVYSVVRALLRRALRRAPDPSAVTDGLQVGLSLLRFALHQHQYQYQWEASEAGCSQVVLAVVHLDVRELLKLHQSARLEQV